jgi:hypothetical protein
MHQKGKKLNPKLREFVCKALKSLGGYRSSKVGFLFDYFFTRAVAPVLAWKKVVWLKGE